MSKKISVFVVVLIALILVAGCSKLKTSGPEKVAEKFWSAIKAQDVDEAKKYVTQASLAGLQPEDREDKEPPEITLGKAKIEGDIAKIPTTMKDKGDDGVNLQTVLIKEGGEWKVDLEKTMMSMFEGAMGAMTEALEKTVKEDSKQE